MWGHKGVTPHVGRRGGIGQAHALPQPAVEVGRSEPHDAQALRSRVDADPVPGIQDAAQLPVDAHRRAAGVPQDAQGDGLVGGGDHRAVEGHVRGDGGEDDGVGRGGDDRTAAWRSCRRWTRWGWRRGRRRRSRRRGGQAREVHAEGDLPVARQFLQDDVVECRHVQGHPPVQGDGTLGTHQRRRERGAPAVPQEGFHPHREPQRPGRPHRQHQTGLDVHLAAVNGVQRAFHVVGRDFGQEAEGPQVDTEDQRVVLCGQTGAAEEGAVPAERDDQVGVTGSLHFRPRIPPLFVLTPHVDGDAADTLAYAPLPDDLGGHHGVGAPSVDDDAHPLHAHAASAPSGLPVRRTAEPYLGVSVRIHRHLNGAP